MSLARQLDDLFFGLSPNRNQSASNTNKNSNIYEDDESSEDEAYLAEIRRQEEIERKLVEERGFTRLELETCTKVLFLIFNIFVIIKYAEKKGFKLFVNAPRFI